MAVAVSVSTLHGDIVDIKVAPSMLVSTIKAKTMEHTPMDISPLGINADWAEVMSGCNEDDLDGIRLCTFDGVMMEDNETLGSQLAAIDILYKVVFVKQKITKEDRALVMTFADPSLGMKRMANNMRNESILYIMPVVPAWWDHNHQSGRITGLLFQHANTAMHCYLRSIGMDPKAGNVLPPVDKLLGEW